MVPQSGGTPTTRAIAFADFGWFVAQYQVNPLAIAAAAVLDHLRSF
jgi:hypothetical protein